MKRKIHVIPHSHWDREWYFTTSRSKVYLMKDLGDVLNTLENDPEFKYFMVDAQGSLLDDYIKWRPQDKERISKLVNDGRLVIGPWYTQTDQLVISGESIVRNMYYGMKRCESLWKIHECRLCTGFFWTIRKYATDLQTIWNRRYSVLAWCE